MLLDNFLFETFDLFSKARDNVTQHDFSDTSMQKIILIFLRKRLILSVGNAGCPDGWVPRHTLEGYCYCSEGIPIEKRADYAGAEHACEDLHSNAYVMSIDEQNEEDFFIKIN